MQPPTIIANQSPTTTNGTGSTTGPRLVANRKILSRGSRPSELAHMSLEEVRDLLARIKDKQDPVDHDRSFEQLHMEFRGGRVTAQFLGPRGLEGEPMLVHENAFSQMGSAGQSSPLMPSYLARNLLETAKLGSEGESMATAMWALWRRGNSKPRNFRTINIKDPGTGAVRRCLRSQHSQKYATYDNLQFVQDLLDFAPDLRDAPVMDFTLTDMAMRLRFALESLDNIEVNKPIPMLEAWDSEAGRRRVTLRDLIWKLVCANGMSVTNDVSKWAWTHIGDAQRIQSGVQSAYREIETSSSGAVQAYDEALNIGINNAMLFLDQQLTGMGATQDQVLKAQGALSDPTTTPGGTLASAVDAVTLIAQDYDLFVQSDLERMAGSLLNVGRGEALHNGGRILVEHRREGAQGGTASSGASPLYTPAKEARMADQTTDQDTKLFSFTRELVLDGVESGVEIEAAASGGYSSDSATLELTFDGIEHDYEGYITEADIEDCSVAEVTRLVASLLKHHPDQCKDIDGVTVIEAAITPEGVISWLKTDPVRLTDVLARMVQG